MYVFYGKSGVLVTKFALRVLARGTFRAYLLGRRISIMTLEKVYPKKNAVFLSFWQYFECLK